MSNATVIPTPATPDVCSIDVLVDGEQISTAFHVLSASVSNELNRIPSASLQLRDGEAAQQTFAASDTDHFVPGVPIELRFGYRGETDTVFRGTIVKHRIRIRENGTHLSLECRDDAIRMTRGRRSRVLVDTTDGDVIDEVIGAHGLERDVATTKPSLREIIQFDATDWDFVVERAQANGHVVAVRDGVVTVGPPAYDAEPVIGAQFGATVLQLDAEIDARWQAHGVAAIAWSGADQALVEVDASEPSALDPGNLSVDDLASVLDGDPEVLRHGGQLTDPELQAWADARLLRERLAKIRGRARFQGFAGITAGDVVDLTGVGERFTGRQYVSGIRHTFADGNWETDAAFGLPVDTHAERYPVTALPAGGLLPAVNGLQIGVVIALEDDPDGEERIQIRLPVTGSEEGVWARLATLDAGSDRGTFFRPEIDDEVVVGFLAADPRYPIVLGQLHSSAKPAPEPGSNDNFVKGYKSASGIRLGFDDDKVVATLETPAGNLLSLSEDDSAVKLADQNGNSIVLDADGITIESAKDVVIKATGDLKLDGVGVVATASAQLTAKGEAGAELSSGGVTTVKGSLVQVN